MSAAPLTPAARKFIEEHGRDVVRITLSVIRRSYASLSSDWLDDLRGEADLYLSQIANRLVQCDVESPRSFAVACLKNHVRNFLREQRRRSPPGFSVEDLGERRGVPPADILDWAALRAVPRGRGSSDPPRPIESFHGARARLIRALGISLAEAREQFGPVSVSRPKQRVAVEAMISEAERRGLSATRILACSSDGLLLPLSAAQRDAETAAASVKRDATEARQRARKAMRTPWRSTRRRNRDAEQASVGKPRLLLAQGEERRRLLLSQGADLRDRAAAGDRDALRVLIALSGTPLCALARRAGISDSAAYQWLSARSPVFQTYALENVRRLVSVLCEDLGIPLAGEQK